MDEDKFALVEKILKDVSNIMCKNAELRSFDIVPVDTNFQNKSPVLHLENCLGLESWCVKHVYMYCYSELMDKYLIKPKRKVNKVSSIYSDRLAILLDMTLLLNPDLSSLWNKRREMVIHCMLEKNAELQFARLVLSRKPKCNEAFTHRRWILGLILQDDSLKSNYIENLANEELEVTQLAADKYPNNYHSWNHRIWILKTLRTVEKQFNLDFLHIKEYEFSERWTSKHVSDFSGFHYRQFCIKNIFTLRMENWKAFDNSLLVDIHQSFIKLLLGSDNKVIQTIDKDMGKYCDEKLLNLLLSYTFTYCNCAINHFLICKKLEILFYELHTNNDLLRFYKHHETLWYHRRFILHELMVIMYEYFGFVRQNGALVRITCNKCNIDESRQKQAKIVRYDSNRIYSSVLFNVLVCHEKKFIEERRNDSDNYADRHDKYLKFVEGHVM